MPFSTMHLIPALLFAVTLIHDRPSSLTSDIVSPRNTPSIQAESLLVSAAWVAAHLDDPNIVVLQVEHDENVYAGGHIPGARFLSYMAIIANRDNRGSELPAERLQGDFSQL